MKIKETEKEFSVQAPWGKISGIAWGNPSNPPVLLVHGKLDVCTGFRPLVALLPDRFYYVAFDIPGNGRSEPLPRGVRYTVLDLVPSVMVVIKHFGWDRFIYVGHSLGALIGKYFNIAFPDRITRVVEIDPVPAHHNWATSREGLRNWYHAYYGSYDEGRYHKFHGGKETAPKYTYEKFDKVSASHLTIRLKMKASYTRIPQPQRNWLSYYQLPEHKNTVNIIVIKAQEMMMKTRKMTKEATENVLERCLEPAGDGLYRFTYDQRMKEVTVLPFSGEILKQIYTTATTPTFAVIAQGEMDRGMYDNVHFVWQEELWRNNNYTSKIVEGGHDVHIYNPECMADDISKFLLKHYQSKL